MTKVATQRKRMNATKRADELFSNLIRARAIGCWAVGHRRECSMSLQCCHIISRRYRGIRWDERNAVAMCGAHHTYFTHHPLEWEDYAKMRGVKWDQLRRLALYGTPEKAVDALARLKSLSEEG